MAFGNTLMVKLGLNSTEFQRSLLTSKDAVKKWAKGVGGLMVATLGVASMIRFTKKVHDFSMSLHDTSKRLKTSTFLLQAWSFQLSQNGVSAEEGVKALTKLSQVIGEARMGKGLLLDVTKNFGLELDKENGEAKTSQEVLADLADIIQNTTNNTDKVAIATAAFGRAGAKLVPVLEGGSEGMEEFAQRAREAGMILDEASIEGIAKADASLERLNISTSVAGGKVLPTLYTMVGKLVDLFNIFTQVLRLVTRSVQFLIMGAWFVLKQEIGFLKHDFSIMVEAWKLGWKHMTFSSAKEIAKQRANLKKAQQDRAKFIKESRSIGKVFADTRIDGKTFSEDLAETNKAGKQMVKTFFGMNKPIKVATKSTNELTGAVEEAAEAEKKLQEQAEKYLASKNDALATLERQQERVDALVNGGEKELELVERRHKIADKAKALMKSANISRAEAVRIITQTLKLENEEKTILADIKEGEKEVNKVVSDKRKLIEENIEAKKKEQAIAQKNRDDLEKDLAIMQAKAQGNDKLAQRLTMQKDLAVDMAKMAKDLGITEREALGIIEKKLRLERQIAQAKKPQEHEAVKEFKELRAFKKLDEQIKDAERRGHKFLAGRLQGKMDRLRQKHIPPEVQVQIDKQKADAKAQADIHAQVIKNLNLQLDAKVKAEKVIADKKLKADIEAKQVAEQTLKNFADKANEVQRDMERAIRDLAIKLPKAIQRIWPFKGNNVPSVKTEVKLPKDAITTWEYMTDYLSDIAKDIKGRFTNE